MPLCLLALAFGCTSSGVTQPYTVGVFDVRLTGGMGASSGFLKAFDDMPEYQAEALGDLDLSALYRLDILVLYDMHEPGAVVTDWRSNLAQFAQAGGSHGSACL